MKPSAIVTSGVGHRVIHCGDHGELLVVVDEIHELAIKCQSSLVFCLAKAEEISKSKQLRDLQNLMLLFLEVCQSKLQSIVHGLQEVLK